MRRRDLISGTIGLPMALAASRLLPEAQAADPQPAPFDADTVRKAARALSAKPFQAPDNKLPDALANLTYDQYRSIRFDPAHAIWRGQGLPFELQLFHRGFLYKDRVDLFEVAGGQARPIGYNPDLFQFGLIPRPNFSQPGAADLGFAGFRVHAPINRPDYFDEVCVFLGASYFRAVAKGQVYGLSARGLAINTADPGGEEFPVFRSFWLERPQPGTNALVVHALLDSRSTAAAYRFTIRPGDETIFDVEMTLYPRVDIAQAGIAPMTSMFFFDANDRGGVDDYRRAVHDSDGLLMWNGRGEQLWRPLSNPANLQISAFADTSPRGFGLMQRKRVFDDYEDLESHYEKRPGLWCEPIGNAGDGAIMLIEIPTKLEINDNIVGFWRPKNPIQAHSEYNFTYRLHWCVQPPIRSDLARFIDSRSGAGGKPDTRLFVLDVVGDALKALPADAQLRLDTSADHGELTNIVLHPNPETSGWRVSFELSPKGAKAVELRAQMMDQRGPVSEAWVYRWTA